MIAEAYAYAEGNGELPKELKLAQYIDRFGVEAVTGKKVLGARDIYRITVAENVVRAYADVKKASSYPAWANEHPEMAKLLLLGGELNKVE